LRWSLVVLFCSVPGECPLQSVSLGHVGGRQPQHLTHWWRSIIAPYISAGFVVSGVCRYFTVRTRWEMQVQSNTVVCSDFECIFARIVSNASCISASKVGSSKH
jgi:hypothetical protein